MDRRVRRRRFLALTAIVAGLGWAAASAPSVLSTEDGASPPLGLIAVGAAALGVAMGAALGAVLALLVGDHRPAQAVLSGPAVPAVGAAR